MTAVQTVILNRPVAVALTWAKNGAFLPAFRLFLEI